MSGEIREATVMQLIRVMTTRGSGLSEYDPVRVIETYWTLDGKQVAEYDPQHPTPFRPQ